MFPSCVVKVGSRVDPDPVCSVKYVGVVLADTGEKIEIGPVHESKFVVMDV